MSSNEERPMMYEFITVIVDDVHKLRPDMSRADVEASIGPIVCGTVTAIVQKAFDLLAEDITETFGTAPEHSALVNSIAEYVHNFLMPRG